MVPVVDEKPSVFQSRPTVAEVDLAHLRHNVRAFQGLAAPAKVMAVVKANGYGSGLVPVARAFQEEGIDALGVAYIEEALELRQNGITVPILAFGGLLKEQVDLYIQNNVDVTASSVSKLEQVEEAAQRLGCRARVHLKIDTGLERIGVHYYSSQSLYDAALRAKYVDVVGVYSHFADVVPGDLALARLQLERFLGSLRYFEERAPAPFLKHIAATGGTIAFPESRLDMVRPGLGLYGVYPGPGLKELLSLLPVLSLKSQVVYFKVVKKGAGVSYGHRWIAPHDTRVVTVPIGYGDGFSRQLSQKIDVLIRGKRYRQVGNICMDLMMVNIGDGEAYNGDEVVLLGEQLGEGISAEELADAIGTTPHEILVALNQRIPRVYRN
jgi:alanine racemase